jgi:hypothetical protein
MALKSPNISGNKKEQNFTLLNYDQQEALIITYCNSKIKHKIKIQKVSLVLLLLG